MKKDVTRFIILPALLLILSVRLLSAATEEKQPRMELAIQFLEDALKAEDPVPLIRKAKEELEKVMGPKGGFRERAIEDVNIALADANAGKIERAHADITTTIAAIHSGMAHARMR